MRGRWVAVGIGSFAALALLAGALALDLCARGDPAAGAGEDGEATSTANGAALLVPEVAPPTLIRGAVLVEAHEEEAVDDEGPRLIAAPSCVAIAWRGGAQIGAPARCDQAGRYALSLAEAPPDLAIEVLAPGHLRAVLEVRPVIGGSVEAPTVALGAASVLAGIVVDERGAPLSGVSLRARPRPDLGEPEPWRATTDEEGRFRLDTVPSGPITVEASRPGFALSVLDAVAPTQDATIVLDGLYRLSGDVLGPPEALARARVWIEGSSIWPPIAAPVGSDGVFVFEGIADGIYGLVAEAPARRAGEREYASIPLENVSPTMTVSLALIEAARVPVRAVDPEGRAVSGALVTLGGASVGMLHKVAETGPSGQLQIGPVVPGPYLVHADAPGYLPSGAIAVDVQSDDTLPELTLTLTRPARIFGRVVDEGGEAVAEARVTVESEVLYSPGEAIVRAKTLSARLAGGALGVTTGVVPPIPLFDDVLGGEWVEGATASDREGVFALDQLLPGSYRLRALHSEHAASALVTITLSAGEVRGDVLLVLRTGFPLTGRIRDGNDRPIAGARVELDDGQILTTDERGIFDAGLHRDERSLILRAPGMIPRKVVAKLERGAVDLELRLDPAEGAIEGRIRDTNGQPLVGARVGLVPEDGLASAVVAYTDDRGLFSFEGLAPGMAELSVEHPEFASTSERLKIAARPDGRLRELRLDRGWELAVVVRAAGSGDPVVGAVIMIDGQIVTTDAAGEASMTRLSRGEVSATIEASGWVREQISVRRPESGGASVVVDLEEGAAIEGRIRDDRGDPVDGAKIVIRHRESGEILAETRSDAAGLWRVERLPEGDVWVEAAPPAAMESLLAPLSEASDVLRGRVTRGVDLRFDRL